MSLRDKINSPVFGTSVVIIFGVAAVIFIIQSSGNSYAGFGDTLWVYNIDTESLTKISKEKAIPPIQLEDGTGYTARVYSCDGGEYQVAYIKKYTPQAFKALGDELVIDGNNAWVVLSPARSELIATVEAAKNDKWMPGTYGNVEKLINQAKNGCGGEYKEHLP